MNSKVIRSAALLFTLVASSALGQQAGAAVAPKWGTAGFSIYTVGAWAFQPIDSAAVAGGDEGSRYIVSGGACFIAPINLPTGAVIDHLELEGCDNSDSFDLSASLVWCLPCTEDQVLFTSGVAGCHRFTSEPIGIGVLNQELTYMAKVCTPGGSDTSFTSLRVYYQLQVSGAPAVPTFNDVPTTNPYFQFVEALAASGITAGCGGGNFCPDSPVTRAQMATFLAKALGLYFPN